MLTLPSRCHGNLDTHPGCYHPGPGVVPVWASDLTAAAVVALIISAFAYACYRITRD